MFLLFSTINCKINYIKNYYHIPSYSLLDECFKTEFYEYTQNNIKNNVENITFKEDYIYEENNYYKTNLDKIILYLN